MMATKRKTTEPRARGNDDRSDGDVGALLASLVGPDLDFAERIAAAREGAVREQLDPADLPKVVHRILALTERALVAAVSTGDEHRVTTGLQAIRALTVDIGIALGFQNAREEPGPRSSPPVARHRAALRALREPGGDLAWRDAIEQALRETASLQRAAMRISGTEENEGNWAVRSFGERLGLDLSEGATSAAVEALRVYRKAPAGVGPTPRGVDVATSKNRAEALGALCRALKRGGVAGPLRDDSIARGQRSANRKRQGKRKKKARIIR